MSAPEKTIRVPTAIAPTATPLLSSARLVLLSSGPTGLRGSASPGWPAAVARPGDGCGGATAPTASATTHQSSFHRRISARSMTWQGFWRSSICRWRSALSPLAVWISMRARNLAESEFARNEATSCFETSRLPLEQRHWMATASASSSRALLLCATRPMPSPGPSRPAQSSHRSTRSNTLRPSPSLSAPSTPWHSRSNLLARSALSCASRRISARTSSIWESSEPRGARWNTLEVSRWDVTPQQSGPAVATALRR